MLLAQFCTWLDCEPQERGMRQEASNKGGRGVEVRNAHALAQGKSPRLLCTQSPSTSGGMRAAPGTLDPVTDIEMAPLHSIYRLKAFLRLNRPCRLEILMKKFSQLILVGSLASSSSSRRQTWGRGVSFTLHLLQQKRMAFL